ncbi:DUF1697 domain-containing protein [Sphingobacterium rhinopitheci]|uniref:DUF1697 domain-containing protein n=1 Tax=Sphingobacterium rhinopitheci TaxID=2781960 RepID=UPI001F519D2C|nr:DUF1697 domain-containing protein [Sphingobacterium rhinopitheci]MCI0921968.1 DUF1697 domain-containing protein [Sphingobacterium rhinopitheci]
MTGTYIAILRGINVAGQKAIKMVALKSMFEGIHCNNVKTYIQSGNVIFSAATRDIKEQEYSISSAIEDAFGFPVPVIVLTINTMEMITANNPFADDDSKDPSFVHITFLANKPEDHLKEKLMDKIQDNEACVITDEVVYLYCPHGYGKTKLNNTYIENNLKVSATTRNWKTCMELLKIALST